MNLPFIFIENFFKLIDKQRKDFNMCFFNLSQGVDMKFGLARGRLITPLNI